MSLSKSNAVQPDVTVWYELEYSFKREEDWYASSGTADTEDNARRLLHITQLNGTGDFEYRLVRKTLATEVLA